mgnify:CR=1 FL=1
MPSLPRNSALLVSPMNWKPEGPEDLIGQAARVAKAQVTKARPPPRRSDRPHR